MTLPQNFGYLYLVPAGTQHQNDVVSTSMRRDHVASTLIRRHFNVVCPLGLLFIISLITQPDFFVVIVFCLFVSKFRHTGAGKHCRARSVTFVLLSHTETKCTRSLTKPKVSLYMGVIWTELMKSTVKAWSCTGETVTIIGYITKTYLYKFDPLKPHFYIVKLGFTGVYIIFLISAQKHWLWVLVRTASPRRF